MTFCDVGCRVKSDGSTNNAVILFCGGMFAGRWLGTTLDSAAQKLGVRLLSVDRPGLGGTPPVDLEHRVQTWLEIVPALLDHVGLKYVALVSHSAGTIYLLNTLLYLRRFLHPTQPYVAMLGPWIHHADTSSTLMSLTNWAPCSSIGNFHSLTSFMLTRIMPSVGPMFMLSGNMAAKIGSSFPSASGPTTGSRKPDGATLILQPGTATAEEATREREILSDLRMKYVIAEGLSGGSQDALLCLKRPKNYWGTWNNYDTLVPRLVASEKTWRGKQTSSVTQKTKNLRVDVFYAANDKLTNGKKGAAWFDTCWNEEERDGVIDFASEIVDGQSHESVIDPDLIEGPIEKVFMLVARQFKYAG